MANRIQLRRGTAAQWTAANPVLAQGEPGIETDTGKQKFGNGVAAWSALPYASVGPAGPPGPVDDTSVAELLADPASETVGVLSATYARTDGTPRLVKALGDTRAGVFDWEFGAGQSGYLFHMRAGADSVAGEYAFAVGLDGGSGGGYLVSLKTTNGIGVNVDQWPGTGVGIFASNRSSTPIVNTEVYAGGGGVIYSLKSGYGRADGVLTAGSPIMTSATANFTAADIGRTVQTTMPKPNDLPAGTTIVSVESATSVTLSKNATATRNGVRFMILGRTPSATQNILRVFDTDTTNEIFAIRQGSVMFGMPVIAKDAGTSAFRVYAAAGMVADIQSWRDSNTNRLSRINKDGRFMSSRNSLPAVGDLDIGEWTLHGDPTTGAEKIYLSIRNSAGNLVTKDLTL